MEGKLFAFVRLRLSKFSTNLTFPPQQTVKRSDDTHEFCKDFTRNLTSACAYLVIQIGSWLVLWPYRAYYNYCHQLMLTSLRFRFTVSTSFTWAILFASTFDSVFSSTTNTCSPHFSVLLKFLDGLAPIQKSESYTSLSFYFFPPTRTRLAMF